MSLAWLDDELERLDRDGLRRRRTTPIAAAGPRVVRDGRSLLNLCSNDYLSLASSPVRAAAGAGASRLIVGDLEVHHELERALASWLDVESVLLFSSGYAANVGALSALATPGSVVVSDALNHASIIDGCRLSRARTVVVPHRDVAAVEAVLSSATEERRIVATDAYFSMDGTLAPLASLAEVCRRHRAALYVDEAHGLGVWGPQGRGAAAAAGVRPDVLIGTLGKAFGSSGAFVAGRTALVDWLWNRARSFVFSTGLPPSSARAALDALVEVRAGKRTRRLHAHAALVREALGSWVPRESVGPILPVVLGDVRRVVEVAGRCAEHELFVQAIRPPTVPPGTARLRLTVQADHDPRDLAAAAARLAGLLR